MGFFTCVQNKLPESDGNGETTLEKGETNPLDVPLDDIAEHLLSFLNGFKSLSEAKKVIEKKYEIKKEHGDCWPADDIKRAWGQTRTMNIKSNKRRYWAHVIILQILKRFMVYDECKQNAAQDDHDDTTNDINQSCETTPGMKESPEDTLSQSSDKLQMWRADLHAFKHKLIEQSSAVLESQLSAPITDVATLPAELREKICYAHSSSGESMNAALVNENEDTLYNNCELPKSIDNCEELNFTDTPYQIKTESENERREDGLWSTDDINRACGKAESTKGNSEDRLSQSSAELEAVEAAGGVKQSSGANRKSSKSDLNQAGSASKSLSGAQFPAGSQATRNDPSAPANQSGTNVSAASESEKADETICIRIPFSAMFSSGSPVSQRVRHQLSHYKLINGFPSDTDLRIRKSYAMSFDTETMNAKLVYEILNRETLVDRCDRPDDFGNGYVKGHLAAARNHRWCREANNDANLFSNMIPQDSTLNNSTWKSLENDCRNMTRNTQIRNVHVYTGPLYRRPMDHSVLGGKRVPSHLFKVIIKENVNGTVEEPECFVIPNEAPQTNGRNVQRVNIEFIERNSGLMFIERRPNMNMRDFTKSVILQGEGGSGEPCEVNISVRISS
ncbi:uncharacterized protein LOC131536001 [Onychostoma macrolepis]|uniref:uncharacterized protein LOC131536001 n=1 Tax=Onychostoma macrolepis TaxID=369639 RepID=UPI0027296B97|nr:uncharacterized protein LOC131536001 [Onychostoma macrolepis]